MIILIKKDTWVQIKKIVLKPEQRVKTLPEATRSVPLLMWTKGALLEDAEIGNNVNIKTVTGRIENGELICDNPSFLHTYGKYIPEIHEVDIMLKKALYGSDD